MKALLIPVKDPSRGKTRLSDFLTPDQRRRLAWAMLEDVFRAAAAASEPGRLGVVNRFDLAAGRARGAGFEVLIEESQTSESASVDWASLFLKKQDFDTVMRLSGDVAIVLGRGLHAAP